MSSQLERLLGSKDSRLNVDKVEMKEKQAMQEQQLTTMEEPVRMMLLDAIFTDAPASAPSTPPSVLLYGLNSDGESIAVHVNDFLPYFWFLAPVCTVDGRKCP